MITQANIWAVQKDNAQNGVFRTSGSGAPTSGASGTGVGVCGFGSTYTDYVTGFIYFNNGTLASPTWLQVGGASSLQRASGTITAAQLVSVAAGNFGHANGVVLAAAPAAGFALQLDKAAIYYTFGVAAYTAGGNITVNWGAGGAALTGLVSAANSVGAASSKAVQFNPLSTAGVAIVSAASLNLVSSAAFTQPGTATGTIAWEIWYRLLTVGF